MDADSKAGQELQQAIRITKGMRGGQKQVLSGWKEVAQYLGRGVRTVQRWESLGLPVRRPNRNLRSAVCAMTADIDHWLGECSISRNCENGEERFATIEARIARLEAELTSLKQELAKQHRMQGLSVRPMSDSPSAA